MAKGLLTVDNGNSNPHIGIFHHGQLEAILSFSDFAQYRQEFLDGENFDVVISNVGEDRELSRELSKLSIDLAPYKSHGQFLGMPVDYAETIGDDRLFESHFIYRHKILSDAETNRVALIDAGTFITVDIISIDGLEGGFILPGTQLLLNSYRKGAKLPSLGTSLLKMGMPLEIPHQTEHAILESTKGMIAGFFNNFFRQFGRFDQVVITGGQGLEICSLLRTHVDGELEYEIIPDLIHYALAGIYQTISAPDFSGPHPTNSGERKGYLRSVPS